MQHNFAVITSVGYVSQLVCETAWKWVINTLLWLFTSINHKIILLLLFEIFPIGLLHWWLFKNKNVRKNVNAKYV